MSQTIKQLRTLASDMGVSFAELVRRRRQRELASTDAVSDDCGVRIKPRVLCSTGLPSWWRAIPRTEIR